MTNEQLKKHSYYLTLAHKNYCKFLHTGQEKYLDKVMMFNEKANQQFNHK